LAPEDATSLMHGTHCSWLGRRARLRGRRELPRIRHRGHRHRRVDQSMTVALGPRW